MDRAAMSEEHRRLKLWEKRRQREVSADNDFPGPTVPCRLRLADKQEPQWIDVHLVKLFQEGLACVCGPESGPRVGTAGGYWMVRDGLDWETFLPRVLQCWQNGQSVPKQFQPLRKLGSPLLRGLLQLPTTRLSEAFERMRSGGLLPALPKLSQSTCPAQLDWRGIRLNFQDFRGTQG